MCLAIPYKIIAINEENWGVILVNGNSSKIRLDLVPEARAGDWVLVYLGSATTIIDEEEASEIIHMFDEVSRMELSFYQ